MVRAHLFALCVLGGLCSAGCGSKKDQPPETPPSPSPAPAPAPAPAPDNPAPPPTLPDAAPATVDDAAAVAAEDAAPTDGAIDPRGPRSKFKFVKPFRRPPPRKR